METAAVSLLAAVLAAILGYMARGGEFRRDRRFAVYTELAGSFVNAAHAGATLFSIHMQLGDKMRSNEHSEMTQRYWREWGDAAAAFETAMAKVRLGSTAVVREAENLETFIEANVRKVPPLWPMTSPDAVDAWGEAAREGPAGVERAARKAAADFGSAARTDMSWSQRSRNRTD
jgi:hypothetical protein